MTIPAAATNREARAVLDSIRRIDHELHRAAATSLKRLGLSAAQLFVLAALADNPGASVNDLAALTFTHQSSVSVVVQRLAQSGRVTRTRSPDDQRRLILELTQKGRTVLRKAPAPPQARLLAALARLPAARRRRLAADLAAWLRVAGLAGEGPAPMFGEGGPGR